MISKLVELYLKLQTYSNRITYQWLSLTLAQLWSGAISKQINVIVKFSYIFFQKNKPQSHFIQQPVDLDVEISADDKKLLRLEKILKSVSPEDVRPFLNTLDEPSEDYDWLEIASRAHQIKTDKREWELMKAGKAKSRAKRADVSEDDKKHVSCRKVSHTNFIILTLKNLVP